MNPNDVYNRLTSGDDLPLDVLIGETAASLCREYIKTGMVTEEDLTILANTVYKLKPIYSVEVGLASASTAITIMASKPEDEQRLHTAFDPAQTKEYHSVGVDRIIKAGLSDHFRLIEQPSYLGMPSLLMNEGNKFDFVYIDANHMFDHTMLEWFYADKLLRVGGVVAFDDVIWPMVHAVVNFVETNCNYRFIKPNDRTWIAVKLSDDTRAWFDFKPFLIPWGNHYKGMIDRVRALS